MIRLLRIAVMTRRPRPVASGGAGGVMHPPNLAKGPLLATKWAKNKAFVGG